MSSLKRLLSHGFNRIVYFIKQMIIRKRFMNTPYHILNGDTLRRCFPKEVLGKQIVVRECFIDGSVEGESLEELFKNRAQFISQNYTGFTENDYYHKTIYELNKINQIPEDSDVYLWFEDDLFCQVNLWFVIDLLSTNKSKLHYYLIRPNLGNEYAFGKMTNEELVESFENRKRISHGDFRILNGLWNSYRESQYNNLFDIAHRLKDSYPFLLPAVKAYVECLPKDNKQGKIIESLISIINEVGKDDFTKIFTLFSDRNAIYGLGDLQVKSYLQQLKNQ